MARQTNKWEVIAKSQTSWWQAEEHDPAKKNVWRMIRFVGSSLLVSIPHAMSGTAHLYRLRNESTDERKNVYSQYPFEVGSRIDECDWEGEVEEGLF
jgi:hypothetical protein